MAPCLNLAFHVLQDLLLHALNGLTDGGTRR
jgi:hypothetical protein